MSCKVDFHVNKSNLTANQNNDSKIDFTDSIKLTSNNSNDQLIEKTNNNGLGSVLLNNFVGKQNNEFVYQDLSKSKICNKHVLLTGGAGYLGTSIVPLLLNAQAKVTVYDLFLNGVSPLLYFTSLNLNLIKGDILDKQHLEQAMKDVDIVIHLAAIVGYPACDANPVLAKAVNVQGTENLINLIKPHQKIIFSSTGSCYGVVQDLCTEETELNPISLYGKTKVLGEKLALKVGGVVLRFATLFGVSSSMRLDLLVNDLTCQALNTSNLDIYEPHFKRTFLHVKDAAKSFLFAIENYDKMTGQVFNVGDDKMNYTKEEVVKCILKYVGNCKFNFSASGEDKDKRDYYVSYEKIKKLGFKSTLTLDEGVKELVKVLPIFTKNELNSFRRLSGLL